MEDKIIENITNDSNKTVEIKTIPCIIYGSRIIEEKMSSDNEPEYYVLIRHNWIELYNSQGDLVGYYEGSNDIILVKEGE